MSYALVTGSASGIGRAIAEELAGKGYDLLLLDMNKEGLEETASRLIEEYKRDIHILPIDLSAPGIGEKIRDWSRPFHDRLNVVINNAGYGLHGPFDKMSLEEQLNMIDTNVTAQLQIAYAFIPLLKQFKRSYLLNVASTTCYQPVPFLAVYAASKAFVLSFTRSLRYELRNTPLSVSCLSPGSTDTNFVHRARMEEHVRKAAKRYNMTPRSVAKTAVKGLFNGKAEIIPGFLNKLNAFMPKFFPKTMVERIAGNIYTPREANAS